jgi:hypothetical protein
MSAGLLAGPGWPASWPTAWPTAWAPAWTVDPAVGHALAAALAVLLLTGAWSKLRDPLLWRETLANYELLPATLVRPVAWLLPLAEAGAGVLLLPLATRGAGALAAAALVALVTAAVGVALARGRGGIDCGCGGETEVPIGTGLVVRNLVLVTLALAAALPPAPRAMVWIDAPTVAGATLFLLGAWALANTLLAQQPRLRSLASARAPNPDIVDPDGPQAPRRPAADTPRRLP